MKIILKTVLVTKSAVFLKSQIQDDCFKYRIKVNQFLFTLKQDYYQNFHPN